MSARAAFVLSGCGNLDGTEIHEAVCALIALDRARFDVVYTAPDIPQSVTMDYLTGEKVSESRNVLGEGARIARGDATPPSELADDDYDLVVLPGGFGAALNLSTFGTEGESCRVNPEVRRLLETAHDAGKPIGAMCIAPVIPARIFPGVRVTIGNDRDVAGKIEAMGAEHVECPVDDAVTDRDRRVVTTPAYMLADGPAQVYAGAVRMVEELQGLLD
jgi:enhancing lycopene biosynthesis protein 2